MTFVKVDPTAAGSFEVGETAGRVPLMQVNVLAERTRDAGRTALWPRDGEGRSMSASSQLRWPDGLRGGHVLAALVVIAAGMIGAATAAQAQSVDRGRAFARANCAICHALDRYSPSPLRIAPPFRDLHNRYPVESLEEALAEGIVTGHPTMPEFRLDPGQVGDFIAFLKSFK